MLTYQVAAAAVNPPIARFDRRTRIRTVLPSLAGTNLDLSRDDTRLAFQRVDAEHNTPAIWVGDIARGASTRISTGPAAEFGPVWSPDSRFLVYTGIRNGKTALLRKLSTGGGAEETLDEYALTATDSVPTVTEIVDWTRDGRYLIAELAKAAEGQNIGTLSATAPRNSVVPVIATPFNDYSARVSIDSHWIAYVSSESGTREIYVQPFPPNGARVQVSVNGGDAPRWRADGRELYYFDRDGSILAVQLTPRGTDLDVSRPAPILDGASADYVVTADGNTFYASLQRPNTADPIYVVTNWTAGR